MRRAERLALQEGCIGRCAKIGLSPRTLLAGRHLPSDARTLPHMKQPTTRLRASLDPEAVRRLLLDAGTSLPLAKALGLVTERGGANADAHRKLKQVSHFLRQLEVPLRDLYARHSDPVVVDAAAGKSYLGLALYDVLMRPEGRGRLLALETRPELVKRVSEIASAQGWTGVEPIAARIAEAPLPERVHLMVALHACDTATDEALVAAIRRNTDYIAVVPCCQAEFYRQLGDAAMPEPWRLLWDHPLHRRELGATLTNAVRASVLRCLGYEVTVTELAASEHSPKNELILGRRVGRFHKPERARLEALLQALPLRPWLVSELLPELLPGGQGSTQLSGAGDGAAETEA